MESKKKYLSVSQVSGHIKKVITTDPICSNVLIKGEISNFKLQRPSNHMYFTLKDKTAQIKCVMFKFQNQKLNFKPNNGTEVLISGKVDVYEPHGTYQIIVSSMEEAGIGNLYIEFEKLKKKLNQLGYFDPKHKKSLPYLPKKIGIATSSTGAAIRDMLSILRDRYENASILVVPTLVQGERAAIDIVDSILRLDKMDDIDLIIIGRGGGSIEDLWCFNEEMVAKAIFECKTPIISAVGHETDFTISDYVADKRAATPTDAARLAVPDKKELKRRVKESFKRVRYNLIQTLEMKKKTLKLLDISNQKRKIQDFINNRSQRIGNLTEKMQMLMKNRISFLRKDLEKSILKINALNPLETLKRGYSVAETEDRKVIKSINDVEINGKVNITVNDGILNCLVENKTKKDI